MEIIAAGAVLVCVVLVALLVRRRRTHPFTAEDVRRERQAGIKQSAATLTGKSTEHLAPLLEAFDFNPRDARFIGDPVDYIVFDGLKEGDLRRVVIVEVKSGRQGQLNASERAVKLAVTRGDVEFLRVWIR